MADQLFDGRKIRALAIVDNYSRQCVAIHVGQSLKGDDVVAGPRKILHKRFGKDYLLPPYFADTAIYQAAVEKNDQNTDHPGPSGRSNPAYVDAVEGPDQRPAQLGFLSCVCRPTSPRSAGKTGPSNSPNKPSARRLEANT